MRLLRVTGFLRLLTAFLPHSDPEVTPRYKERRRGTYFWLLATMKRQYKGYRIQFAYRKYKLRDGTETEYWGFMCHTNEKEKLIRHHYHHPLTERQLTEELAWLKRRISEVRYNRLLYQMKRIRLCVSDTDTTDVFEIMPIPRKAHNEIQSRRNRKKI